MFLLFLPILAIMAPIIAIVKIAVSVVKATVRFALRKAFDFVYSGGHQTAWDFLLFKHIDWKRAQNSQEEMDDEVDRLRTQLGDEDNNGIPDLYDRDVTRPEDDFLHIKYPTRMLRENDYVRFMPRAIGALPQPVTLGAKGLVRSETVNNVGAFCMVKWNAFSRGEGKPALLNACNQMDLHLLGHVNSYYRVTV